MAKPRPTPEEQLLDLIEKGGEGPETAQFKRKRRFRLSFSGLRLFFERGIGQLFHRLKAGLKEPNLKVLNKVFLVISIIILACSVVDFVFGRPNIEGIYERIKPIKAMQAEAALVQEETRPFLHYLEMVRRRNIFGPIELKPKAEPEDKKKTLQDLVKDLSLVGISWEEEPIAMIEDKSANKTYFLKTGDLINKFKVDEILKDKVILRLGEETIDLM